MNNNKIFYVESFSAWYLVFSRSSAAAMSDGVREFGRGCVKAVRPATLKEINYFRNLKGEIGYAD